MHRPPLASVDGLPQLANGHALIDSHCHLDMEAFAADFDAVLRRAASLRVEAMITIGASGPFAANAAAIAVAEAHERIYATVGVHPHEASTLDDFILGELRRLAGHPKVVAVGESGLDYHYDHSPRDAQREAFRRSAGLARDLGLPLVVHLRAADADAAAILGDTPLPCGGVIHCFSGDERSARTFLDLGFHLSFSGIVSFANASDVRAAAAMVPSDRLLVETDAPFLAPAPFRGRRNEPALVTRTAAVLAEVRGVALEEIADCTRENTRRLFRLPG
jgi:TatD DNase family protein